ncbi:hypothetical protein [Paractinoplanes toevensis]|uniref:Uncharacterized protein n=1 Tax=Paractinoplanes toevensis TaxID=571911 RepID=A0A920BQC8_9ACTN|nr:hypothetical protein [Actinoplanes toevensis]GIM97244.1 hypothetical protein Ato02nite_090370 [Actinoplanes toevensis]
MDPVRPQVSPYTVKQFAHGELAKDSGSYVVDLIVELPDAIVHHHLGGGATDSSRQFWA